MKIDTSEIRDARVKRSDPPQEDLTCGLGAALREMRMRKRLTQNDLAEMVGLERTSITNIEKGRQRISVFHLSKIVDALGVEMQITFQEKD